MTAISTSISSIFLLLSFMTDPFLCFFRGASLPLFSIAGFIPIDPHTIDEALKIMVILCIHQQRMPRDFLLAIGFYPFEALIHSIAFHESHLISGLSESPGQNQGPSVYPADIHAADQQTYARKSAPLPLSHAVHILS